MTTFINKLKEDRKEALNRISKVDTQIGLLENRKEIFKKQIEFNLSQQEAFWDLEYKEVKELGFEDLSALEDYLLNPNQTLQEIGIKHHISPYKVSRDIEKHLKIA